MRGTLDNEIKGNVAHKTPSSTFQMCHYLQNKVQPWLPMVTQVMVAVDRYLLARSGAGSKHSHKPARNWIFLSFLLFYHVCVTNLSYIFMGFITGEFYLTSLLIFTFKCTVSSEINQHIKWTTRVLGGVFLPLVMNPLKYYHRSIMGKTDMP